VHEFRWYQTQSLPDQGAAEGKAFAESDFRNGYGIHDKYDDHGFGSRRTDFCLGFKSAYLVELGAMSLAH
jgi:hypothetical protein